MHKVSIKTLIRKSIDRTILILFKPFSLKKWLFLLLIAVLAGNIGGGNGGGGGRRPKKAEAVQQQSTTDRFDTELIGEDYLTSDSTYSNQIENGRSTLASVAIGIGVLFTLAIVVLFTWIGARFKFIWFNAIVNNDASIKEPFSQYKTEGGSLFRFLLILLLMVLGFFGLLALWAYFSGVSAGVFVNGATPSFGEAFKTFALPVLAFVIGFIFLIILNVCIDHFVVTIMAMEHCLFKSAWGRFINIARENRRDFLLYFLVLIGLRIVAGIITFLIALVCLLVILIVGALLLGVPYLLIGLLLKAKLLYIIFAIIVGVPLLAAVILLFMGIGLPFSVFFRNFSLYFLSSLDCGYAPLPLDVPQETP